MSDLFIILTLEEAEAVRGPTSAGAALEPMPLLDGATFVLPEAVLADPDHAARWGILAGLPRRDILPGEWPAPPEMELD